MLTELSSYWLTRVVFERALAAVYCIAFIAAARQFVPLLGARGLLPVPRFTSQVSIRQAPSLFHVWQTDTAFRVSSWIGIAISIALIAGWPQRYGDLPAAIAWTSLWALYLSFVNVGQVFYAFGWEILLLEGGFVAIFLGGAATPPHPWLGWIWAWLLFRLMFGAGMIKLRGDSCWRDLTCLRYYFETQPIPNPLSWYFHRLPASVHRAGVAFNHFVELVVPLFYFAPQPLASIAALLTIAFQFVLIVSGNLSWLNWLTVVLSIPLIDDDWWSWLPIGTPAGGTEAFGHRVAVYFLTALVLFLSVRPARNLISRRQMMNFSFNALHLVNTYGAFGSITRTRFEIVIEGTDAETIDAAAVWRAYEFPGKPGDPARRPRQIAPYHLRLDWLMWFAAMSPRPRDLWFQRLLEQLLEGNHAALRLFAHNPFPDGPPRFVRARYYRYRFTTRAERRATGAWWHRDFAGEFVPATRL